MPSADAFLAARDFLLAHRDNYAAACAGFRWPVLDRFNWALDYFDRIPGRDRLALMVLDEAGRAATRTFAEMSARSNRVANWLRSLGAGRGDRILVMLGNEPALWETMLAAIKLGAVVVPATTLLVGDDLRDRLERGRVRYVVAASAHAEKFAAVPGEFTRIAVGDACRGWHGFEDAAGESDQFLPEGETRAEDPLLLYFTSGTTAHPKLVLHSHQSYPVGHLSTMYWLGLGPGDVHWNISSPGWAKHAWSCFFAPWNAGATVFAYNYRRFQTGDTLRVLVEHGVTTLCAPPTIWRMLVQADLAAYPVRLRELASAGEPLNAEIIQQVRAAWGITIRDGFGQTETTCLVGNSPGQPVVAGSMGRPLPGCPVLLLDAGDRPASEGEICLDLAAHPTGLMLGYAGANSTVGDARSQPYYRTGDIAVRDETGYITYIGRADDVFKASDYRISPFELESVLIEHPAVAEAAVVPAPDPVRLAVPKAFLLLAAGYTPSAELARDIFAFTLQRLAPYKRVRRLEFGELPKTISGKIRRVDLRRQAQASPASGAEFRLEDFPGLQ